MRSSSFVGKFQVLAVKRLRNSYYGNPKWEVAICAIDVYHDTRYIATTQTNSSAGFVIGHHSYDLVYEMKGYFSKKGNVIIETAREV